MARKAGRLSFAKLTGNSLFSGSAVYLFSNILNAAIPFALLPVLTRVLSPSEYGEVAMFQTLLAALGAFTGISMAGAANRKFYDEDIDEGELKYFIASGLQLLLSSTLIVLLVLFVLRDPISRWLGLQLQWILCAALVSAATVVVQLRLGQWQVRKSAKKYGAMQISQSLLNMVLSIFFVVVLLLGSGGRIGAQVSASIVFSIIALFLLRRDGLFAWIVWRPCYLKEILAFGVPLIPHVAGVFLLNSVDRFVINSKLGLADAGIYMVAVQLAGAMGLVFDAINKAYVPWLFERLRNNLYAEKQKIVRHTYVWFVLIFCGAGLVALAGPFVVRFVAGERYARAGEVIGWLALGQAFGGMYLMVTNYIFYSKRTGLLSLATISSGLINVALLLGLTQFLGLEGAAVAYCVAMAFRFLLTWWVAQMRYPMPWFSSVRFEAWR